MIFCLFTNRHMFNLTIHIEMFACGILASQIAASMGAQCLGLGFFTIITVQCAWWAQ